MVDYIGLKTLISKATVLWHPVAEGAQVADEKH